MDNLEPVWGQIKTQRSEVALGFVKISFQNNLHVFSL